MAHWHKVKELVQEHRMLKKLLTTLLEVSKFQKGLESVFLPQWTAIVACTRKEKSQMWSLEASTVTEIDEVDERIGKTSTLILNDEDFPKNETFHFKIVFLT